MQAMSVAIDVLMCWCCVSDCVGGCVGECVDVGDSLSDQGSWGRAAWGI